MKALAEDPRVKSLDAASSNVVQLSDRRFVVPPRQPKGGPSAMRTEGATHGHNHALVISPPVKMHVQVPHRLQASSLMEQKVPSEDYWVAWNGVLLTVLWEHKSSRYPYGQAGGLVVLSILKDAAEKAGTYAKALSCGSNCGYPFAHSDLHIVVSSSTNRTRLSPEKGVVLLAEVPGAGSAEEVAANLLDDVAFSARMYATMRSHGRVILAAEDRARASAADLLQLQYSNAVAASLPLHQRLVYAIKNRGSGRRSSGFIASILFMLATMEENKREWVNAKLVFDQNSKAESYDLLFKREYPQEVNLITSLDTSGLRAAVSQTSLRINNRIIALATAGGAVAGGVLGAIAAVIGQ